MTPEAPRFQSRATPAQVENRRRLAELFENTPLPLDELLVNFPLYTRASAMAKVLYLDELYRHVIPLPGVIIEFGTWWGATSRFSRACARSTSPTTPSVA